MTVAELRKYLDCYNGDMEVELRIADSKSGQYIRSGKYPVTVRVTPFRRLCIQAQPEGEK